MENTTRDSFPRKILGEASANGAESSLFRDPQSVPSERNLVRRNEVEIVKKTDEALEYVVCHGKLPNWDMHAAIDPAHQWASNVVEVLPAGWAPTIHAGFLNLRGVKARPEDVIGELLRKTKEELKDLFGITFTCGSHSLSRYHLKDESQILAWLETVNPKLINRSHTAVTDTDPIDTNTSKRRRTKATTKKKAAKKKTTKKVEPSGRGRPSTFEHESDFIKMLKRKNGCSVAEASEKFDVDPATIRKQIDRLRRAGHDISRGQSRGVFVLLAA